MRGTRTTHHDYRTAPDEIDMRRLKEEHDIARIASWATPLAAHAGMLRGPCPLHEERASSFVVDEASQTFRCESCGAAGDVVDFVRLLSGSSQIMACEWLIGSERTCRTTELSAVRAAAGRRALAVGNARAIWRVAKPIAGTPAEAYLRSLGLDPHVLGGIRFANSPIAFETTGKSGPCRPALVAACQDVDGAIVGMHRTFLDEHGAPAIVKGADVAVGQVQGTTLRFGPQGAMIVLCADLVEGLAVRQMLPWATVWTALAPDHFAETVVPMGTRRLVLAGRGDRTDSAAITRARAAFTVKQMRVDVIRPSGGHATFVAATARSRAG